MRIRIDGRDFVIKKGDRLRVTRHEEASHHGFAFVAECVVTSTTHRSFIQRADVRVETATVPIQEVVRALLLPKRLRIIDSNTISDGNYTIQKLPKETMRYD